MNYLKKAYTGIFLIACLFTTSANATLITVTDTQEQTSDYQDFVFNWSINDWALNTSAELVLEVQADLGYSGLEINETFNILLEGLDLGEHGRFNNGLGGWTELVQNSGINAWKVSRTFTISAFDMASLLIDNSFNLMVNFNDGVDKQFGILNGTNPYVTATVNYTQSDSLPSTIPEPATLAFLAFSILGLTLRKKNI
jgi:hypothetical protein